MVRMAYGRRNGCPFRLHVCSFSDYRSYVGKKRSFVKGRKQGKGRNGDRCLLRHASGRTWTARSRTAAEGAAASAFGIRAWKGCAPSAEQTEKAWPLLHFFFVHCCLVKKNESGENMRHACQRRGSRCREECLRSVAVREGVKKTERPVRRHE